MTEILQIYAKLNKLGNEVRCKGRIFGLSCAQVILFEGMPFTRQDAFAVGNSEAAQKCFRQFECEIQIYFQTWKVKRSLKTQVHTLLSISLSLPRL